jgi:hypothetical protein
MKENFIHNPEEQNINSLSRLNVSLRVLSSEIKKEELKEELKY